MNILGRLLLIAATVLHGNVVWSADAAGNFAADGVGQLSCQSFVEAIENNDQARVGAYAGWMTGFISGYNVHTEGVYDVTPWQTTELLLLKMKVFCENNPDTAFLRGVGGLLATLADDAMTVSSRLVSVRNQGKAVALYAVTLQLVRQELESKGYAISDPSGKFGTDFAKAITSYQQAEGLPQTGLPDQSTLNRLLD